MALLVDSTNLAATGGFYIDKTLFIRDFILQPVQVTAILRPRRFGKSSNLNLLRSFLGVSHDFNNWKSRINAFFFGRKLDIFQNLEISRDTKFVESHFRHYPVIFLDLKCCKKCKTWKDMLKRVWTAIRSMVEDHKEILEKNRFDIKIFKFSQICPSTPSESDIQNKLEWLIDALHQCYGQRKVIVLIDEYDTPLNHAFREGYYSEAAQFFHTFIRTAFENTQHTSLFKACLMGIVELSGKSIFSGLSNARICSVTNDDIFAEHFGFTIKEIERFLNPSAAQLEELMHWYYGYSIGLSNIRVINPWSFANYMVKNCFHSYWVETSSERVSALFGSKTNQFYELASNLLAGRKIVIPDDTTDNESIAISDWNIEKILNLLVHVGYITFSLEHNDDGGVTRYACIPNHELRNYWEKEFRMRLRLRRQIVPILIMPHS
jgi:Predicted AAA-ATPase